MDFISDAENLAERFTIYHWISFFHLLSELAKATQSQSELAKLFVAVIHLLTGQELETFPLLSEFTEDQRQILEEIENVCADMYMYHERGAAVRINNRQPHSEDE